MVFIERPPPELLRENIGDVRSEVLKSNITLGRYVEPDFVAVDCGNIILNGKILGWRYWGD